MPNPLQLVLASASPARRKLLQMAGIPPIVCPSDFDEDSVTVFDPGQLVQVLAQGKARVIVNRLRQEPALRQSLLGSHELGSSIVVLGCDSVLLVNGEVYGKPDSPAEAMERWQQMRGKIGDLYTGHVLIDLASDRELIQSATTRVHFATPTDAEIAAYIATGEPMQCAGCFALEGRGGLFVEKIEGCHMNVIGLSLPLLRRMLGELGYDVTQLWQTPAL
ncbi:MAG: nucleoside triphosphate pyrophosphatase [Limnothrix sp.]|uniref:Maf family protein n=1 Tax=unclassified Limnothrix TaxID=2632864 RepID=UPI00081D59CB|nr:MULTISPECIES: nucleoside triphosphate pyrophosphatase [unclassified Limnothrix]MEB3116954.1 nucleoside triphosphate pyrophosphatase [Limnothrix sp.]OCQ95817.1 septum formation inhibitor Maf [Limnothrix sp. P13C2]MBD2553142.1 septum formation inhibitor Maf [Limnothrix sp. FACHB-708]MBD2592280.1 septum formation inhibitor Maf [Limnothrix sp. FACHB-406]PIB14835.1 septum formation protein Maf [Limnothrix sp. PR1529]